MHKKLSLHFLLLLATLLSPLSGASQDWYATVPYNYGFEDYTENGAWILLNGDSSVVNKWYIDSATNNTAGGSKALYISNTEGVTYNYDNSMSSAVIAYRDFVINSGTYLFTFDWNGVGEGRYDALIAALVPANDSTSLVGSTFLPNGVSSMSLPAGWISLGGDGNSITLSGAAGWTRQQKVVDIAISQNYRLLFIWANDDMEGSNPPAAVDNIAINVSLYQFEVWVHAENVALFSMKESFKVCDKK